MSEITKKVRTRFAPSPTGYVHIGNLRTELFNYLFTRHHGGIHVLRIEDTDQNRLVPGAMQHLLEAMANVSITFDEGPFLGKNGTIQEQGKFGPYIQSKRIDIYLQHAKRLIDSGHAYYCFCDEARLEELKKEQTALKKPPMYDRLCRGLSPQQAQNKLDEFITLGKKPVIRQAIPLAGKTMVHDLIYGDIVFDHSILDDQVLLKSDGFPTYHLAVVVDDHLMEISHVIRGEEWISSTPKHILLYQNFGWNAPIFAHAPVVLNPDKSKLSKRQGDVSLEDFLTSGYLKEALINFLVFLGWNPKTEQEIFSLQDLIKQFDLKNINKASPIFDIHKLDWINSLYIRAKSIGELTQLLIPYWKTAGYEVDKLDGSYLEAIAQLEQERLKKLSEIGERTQYFFIDPNYEASLLVWKKATAEDAKIKLQKLHEFMSGFSDADFQKNRLEQKIKDFISKNNYDNGSVLWPLRVALTGLVASPSPFEVASVLAMGPGKETVLQRIKKAITLLS